jgi:hypothetical protein
MITEIVDSDIATIEALHDLLLDAHGYSPDFITLKRARELVVKMQRIVDQHKIYNTWLKQREENYSEFKTRTK